MGEWKYSSTILDFGTVWEVGGHILVPTAVPLRLAFPVPVGWEAGWASETVWTLWRGEWALASAGSLALVVQPLARSYTDCTIPVPHESVAILISSKK
jgi:hypothetical protein